MLYLYCEKQMKQYHRRRQIYVERKQLRSQRVAGRQNFVQQ